MQRSIPAFFLREGIENLLAKGNQPLRLAGNQTTDVSPLAACVDLQSLDVPENQIVDVGPDVTS